MICRKCKKEVPDGKFCLECGTNQTPPAKAKRRRANGEGTIIKEDNGTYTAIKRKYIEGSCRTWKKRGFKKRADALEYLATFNISKVKSKSTIKQLYEAWSTSALTKLSASKQTAYKIAWEKLSEIQHDDITQLTIGDLQQVIDKNAPTHYPARDMKSLLSHLYKRACAQGDVPSNLAQYIVLPSLEEKETVPFAKEEIELLWSDYEKGSIFTGYILLMIYTGMMPGELLVARKDMIDWEKRLIVGAGLKTKKRKSTPIVLADTMIPVLENLCTFSKGEKLLTMNKDRFYVKYYETLERVGCRKLSPYACRHTTGTNLVLDAKVPPSVIQEVMRHSKFTTTQRYIHPDTEATLDAVNRLQGIRAVPISLPDDQQTH